MIALTHALTLTLLVLFTSTAHAQGGKADYDRAASLESRVRNKVLNASTDCQWLTPTTLYYTLARSDGTLSYESLDASTGTRAPLFDHANLATQLESLLSAKVDANRLPIDEIAHYSGGLAILLSNQTRTIALVNGKAHLLTREDPNPFAITPLPVPRRSTGSSTKATSLIFINQCDQPVTLYWINAENQRKQYATLPPGESHRQGTFQGHCWVACDASGKDIAAFAAEARSGVAHITNHPSISESPKAPTAAPASTDQLFIRDHNIWMRPKDGSETVALTTDGTDADSYTQQIIISPDSKYAIAIRTKRTQKRKVYYIESSPRDQIQPKLHTYDYPKPGDDLDTSQPVLVDLTARSVHTFDSPLLANPWSIDRFEWTPDSSRCLFVLNQRGHQIQRVLSIDAAQRTLHSILEERSNTFIDYSQKTAFHYLPDSDEFIWMSERSGYNHLYRVQAQSGVITPITSGNWVVRSIDDIDRKQRTLAVRIMGIDPEQDPYQIHFARVSFDGSNFTRLTRGDGTHSITLSPNGDFLIDRYSRPDLPPVCELRRATDGVLIAHITQADWSPLRSTGWNPPQCFVAKGRDGKTDIWGLIHRPTNFDSKRKYPVIEAIYAGPHGQHVPKDFRPHSRVNEIAELGFIVVQIDGMGTNWRSKAFHDVAWKNLHDAGFPDRIAWLKAAAAAHPELDLVNDGRGVGIFGGSAGGQNALAALLWHGDFYKVAAADCGCHDNRMDKVWWNEAWMSWPIGPEYQASSNVVNAHRLPDDAHLLLTVGEMDENVDPASTMQVANALIKANKDFDLIVMPGLGHGAGESPYAARRRADFFVRHLMNVEPRWQTK